MSIIDPPAGWDDVDGINTNERLLGGPGGPLNRAVTGLTARTKQLSDWRDEDLAANVTRSDLAATDGAELVGIANRNVKQRIQDNGLSLLDFENVEAALNAASDAQTVLVVPAGTYNGSAVVHNRPVAVRLEPGAFLDRSLEVSGTPFLRVTSVNVVGDWAAFPAGTTTFPGNFAAFTPGDVVAIELPDAGSAGQGNEAGYDFLVVQSADASQLVTTTGLRWPYRNPVVSRITNAVKIAGVLAKNGTSIAGNYVGVCQVGDVIRIENVDGTDGVEASKAYFELCRVVSVNTSALTVEHSLRFTHSNPWLVKTGTVTGVKISGQGRISRLRLDCCADVTVSGVDVDRYVARLVYNIGGEVSYRRGVSEPSTSNMTWCFYGHANVITCGGSASTTDNAAFKFMSCPGVDFIDVRGQNNQATGAQGNFGVFADYFYTPYRIWNDSVRVRARADVPRSSVTRAAWFTGLRGSTVDYIGAQVFLQRSVDCRFEVLCPDFLVEAQDLVRCRVRADSAALTWDGGIDCEIDVSTRNSRAAPSGRRVWLRAGAIHPETGLAYSASNNYVDVVNYSELTTDVTLYAQAQTGLVIGSKCRDKAGLSASVQFGSGISTPKMQPNFLANALPTLAAWVGARTKGYLQMDGDYRDGGVLMGTMYYWTNTDKLYTKNAKPTLGADGVVVGTQT